MAKIAPIFEYFILDEDGHLKGDVQGHEFHGNQWTGGIGGELVGRLHESGGFTYQPIMAQSPTSGYALSILPGNEKVFTSTVKADDIAQYLEEHAAVFESDPRAHVGGWLDAETGKVYLDVSVVEPDRGRALQLAREHKQLAIYDLASHETVRVEADQEKDGTVRFSAERYGGTDRSGYRKAQSRTEQAIGFKFDPDQPRDDHGRWSETGAGGDAGSATSGASTGTGSEPTWDQPTVDGRPVPIKVETVEEAVPLVLEGKVVEVPTEEDAFTLIEQLAAKVDEMRQQGNNAKDFDLCNVTVAHTNLFCAEGLRSAEYPRGVPRLEMPQLGGVPVPGSHADALPRNPWNQKEVDGAPMFIAHLKELGIDTTSEEVLAAGLRASQRELIGSKVAKMINDRAFDPAKNPVFISRDNYVVDGHHRWAAVVGRDLEDAHLGDLKMNVVRVDAPITEVLHLANTWSKEFGIRQVAGVGGKGICLSCNGKYATVDDIDISLADLALAIRLARLRLQWEQEKDWKFDPDQPRDDHGRWVAGGGGGGAAPAAAPTAYRPLIPPQPTEPVWQGQTVQFAEAEGRVGNLRDPNMRDTYPTQGELARQEAAAAEAARLATNPAQGMFPMEGIQEGTTPGWHGADYERMRAESIAKIESAEASERSSVSIDPSQVSVGAIERDIAPLGSKSGDALIAASRDSFPLTDNIADAGFILPSGDMLDFGRSGMYTGDKEHLDHRQIVRAYGAEGWDDIGWNEADLYLNDYLEKTGAMRIHDDSDRGIMYAQLADNPPTDAQLNLIVDATGKGGMEFEVAGKNSAAYNIAGTGINGKHFDEPTVSELRSFAYTSLGRVDPAAATAEQQYELEHGGHHRPRNVDYEDVRSRHEEWLRKETRFA